MKKENKFWVKILVLPILCFLLGKLEVGNVSGIQDFMTGFVMAVLIIIMLWLVYSLIRSLQEMQSKKEENEDNNIKQ